ncbi:OLC1v1038429C1 [Oldenlandia corymbosa var. corymbosa]|uniref:OLC1v1038429C1 n=1 Tax=Oldenlandia corymbosa var. corymbosa TaxID=529605 RepID=A0AAV1D0X4_OLDCO|nr:OLC1v1038429C1 [Oldenlandia corymbosa var. corymbosa]
MEQFRQIGEVIGSLEALMVFQDVIQINQRQCVLLFNMITFAYNTIAEEIKMNLKFEEKNTKWRALESPLRELRRIIREGECYIRQCLETKDYWAKAISLYQNTDCVEFHMHNLLSCIPVVIEAIEIAAEISGNDQEVMQKKRLIQSFKYHKECRDARIFEWRFGKQYLVIEDFCNRLKSVWEEDRWMLRKNLQERKRSANLTKQEQRLTDLLLRNLNESASVYEKMLPCSTLVSSKDYSMRRRLGNGSQYKEIQWLGESFALRHFFGDIESLFPALSQELALSHPNIMHIFCAFTDEEKKECFLVMELMNKDLFSHIKEVSGPRKRVPFSLTVAVDIMLQIARGMEYLHSKDIYHGELNPSNILVKPRNISTDGYLHAKVCAFGPSLANVVKKSHPDNKNGQLTIWYAPEVLAEQEQCGNGGENNSKYTEKADVYSFGMICFELLTGKVPFEDSHLQGDKMSRNIRAGERPLFPFYSPKYLTSLTKRCWHTDPNQRPSFTSISRILRYVKKYLVMNPENGQSETPMPIKDYTDIEAGLTRSFPSWGNATNSLTPITQIPFQMFLYRIAEKGKSNSSPQENSESGSDASACGDESAAVDDPLPSPLPSPSERPSPSSRRTSPSSEIGSRRANSSKKLDAKPTKHPGTAKGRVRPPQMSSCGRRIRMNSESQLIIMSPRRRLSGHVSDSELS